MILKTEGKLEVLMIQLIMWHKCGVMDSPHFLSVLLDRSSYPTEPEPGKFLRSSLVWAMVINGILSSFLPLGIRSLRRAIGSLLSELKLSLILLIFDMKCLFARFAISRLFLMTLPSCLIRVGVLFVDPLIRDPAWRHLFLLWLKVLVKCWLQAAVKYVVRWRLWNL